jgi:Putative zinc-finger
MAHCNDLEGLLTPYVDGELSAGDHDDVERHLRRCVTCAQRATAERSARDVVRRHAASLTAHTAPPALHARLAVLVAEARPPRAQVVRRWLLRTAVAASLVVGCGLWLTALVTRESTTVLAAQLAADHLKCFLTNHDDGMLEPQRVAGYLKQRYGFAARVPASDTGMGLRLVGARRCITGEGTNAHMLYTWRGQPVSLYMLPGVGHGLEAYTVLGQTTEMWSGHNGTYVLVMPGRQGRSTALADYMRQATR